MRVCFVVLAWLLMLAAPALGQAGRFRLPPVADPLADIAAMQDGSVVVVDELFGVLRRLPPGGDVWRRVWALDGVSGLAATADGGLLVLDSLRDRVMHWRPGGRATVVAGGRRGFAGDGGPAVAAAFRLTSSLPETRGIAALPDGGFLVADTYNHRVRMVDAGGTISTVAGDGRPARRGPIGEGDGGPATAAHLAAPVGVAAVPGGGFVVTEAGGARVRRVEPDGRITTVGRIPFDREYPTDVAVAGNGDVVVATSEGVLRLPAGGGPGVTAFPGPDWRGQQPGFCQGLAADAAGGVFLAGCWESPWYVPSAAAARPAVAVRETAVAGRTVSMIVERTVPAPVRITLLRGDRIVASRQADADRFVVRSRAKGWHRLTVSLDGGWGDGGSVYMADRLTRRAGRRLLEVTEFTEQRFVVFVGPRCRAFGARRIDCELRLYEDTGRKGRERCEAMVSVSLQRSGIPRMRGYPCANARRGVFRRRPERFIGRFAQLIQSP